MPILMKIQNIDDGKMCTSNHEATMQRQKTITYLMRIFCMLQAIFNITHIFLLQQSIWFNDKEEIAPPINQLNIQRYYN